MPRPARTAGSLKWGRRKSGNSASRMPIGSIPLPRRRPSIASGHCTVLSRALGRDPTPGELYLTHQQGIAGGPALLAGGDRPAWQVIRPYYKSDAIAKQAITGNLPQDPGLRGTARSRPRAPTTTCSGICPTRSRSGSVY